MNSQYQKYRNINIKYVKDYSFFNFLEQFLYFKQPLQNEFSVQEYTEDDQLQKIPPENLILSSYLDLSTLNRIIKPKNFQNYIEENFSIKEISKYKHFLESKKINQTDFSYNLRIFSRDTGLNYLLQNVYFFKRYFEPTPLYFQYLNLTIYHPKQLYLAITKVLYQQVVDDKYYQIVNSPCPYIQIKYILDQIHNSSSTTYRKILAEYIFSYYLNEFIQCAKVRKYPQWNLPYLIPYAITFFSPFSLERNIKDLFIKSLKYVLKDYKKIYIFIKSTVITNKYVKIKNYNKSYPNVILTKFKYYKINFNYNLLPFTVKTKYIKEYITRFNDVKNFFTIFDYKDGRYDILLFTRKLVKNNNFLISLIFLENYKKIDFTNRKVFTDFFKIFRFNLVDYNKFFRRYKVIRSKILSKFKYKSSDDFILLNNKSFTIHKVNFTFKYIYLFLFKRYAPIVKHTYFKEIKIIKQIVKKVYFTYSTIKTIYSKFTEYYNNFLNDFYHQVCFNLNFNYNFYKFDKLFINVLKHKKIKIYYTRFVKIYKKPSKNKIFTDYSRKYFSYKVIKSVIKTKYKPLIEHKKALKSNIIVDLEASNFVYKRYYKLFNLFYSNFIDIFTKKFWNFYFEQFLSRKIDNFLLEEISYYVNESITYRLQYDYYLYISPYSFQYFYNLQNFSKKKSGRQIVNDFLKKNYFQIYFSNNIFNVLRKQISYTKKYIKNSFYNRIYVRFKDEASSFIFKQKRINYDFINKLFYSKLLFTKVITKQYKNIRQKFNTNVKGIFLSSTKQKVNKYTLSFEVLNTKIFINLKLFKFYKAKEFSKIKYQSLLVKKYISSVKIYLKLYIVYRNLPVKIINYKLTKKQKNLIDMYLTYSNTPEIYNYYRSLLI